MRPHWSVRPGRGRWRPGLDPVAVVEAVARWFELPVSGAELAEIPRCMARNAKRPDARYDQAAYLRDIAALLDRHRGEVVTATHYVEHLGRRAPIPDPLPQPLMPSAPSADE